MTEPGSTEKKSLQFILEPVSGPELHAPIRLMKRGVIVAGRTSGTHYRFPKNDSLYSRLHFLIEFNPKECRVLDLGSRKGTYVNKERVHSSSLKDGDVIKAGKTSFRVHVGPPEELAQRTLNTAGTKRSKTSDSDESEEERRERKLREKKKAKAKKAKAAAAATESAVKPAKPAKPKSDDSGVIDFDIDRILNSESMILSDEMAAARDSSSGIALPSNEPPQIPGFQIIKSVGKGALGEVFLARRKGSEADLAVKVIRTPRWNDASACEPFLKEMNPFLDLEHANIVRYHEFGVAAGCIYVVMDYVNGINGEALVAKEGPLGVSRVAKAGSQLLLALDYAHGLSHIHRDIKPSNVLLTEANGREIALLSDFGLARAFQNSPLCGLKMKADLERSVRFMAPEQFQNFKEMPSAVDIYSIAATIYYMLTAKYVHDFESLSFDQAIAKIKRDDAVNIIRRRMDVPAEMAVLLHQALNRFPQKRLAAAGLFRREIYKFIK